MYPLTVKRLVPFIVSLALFMESVDTTIINTAIPAMARSLQVNPIDLKIALISYLLTLAVFIPISGWIADKYGIKRVFLLALFVFIGSSLWCGFSHSLSELIIARSVQGLGGAFTLPVGRLIIVRTFARHELITTMTRVIMVSALGMMLGPLLGGVITQHFSWHWIFWVNIPIGLVALVLAHFFLPEAASRKMPPLDKLGFVLFGSSLAGFTFGFSAISETTSYTRVALLIIVISLGLLISYGYHSRRQAYPIVSTVLLQRRLFRISFMANLLGRLGFGGVPFLVPLLLQLGFGYSSQLSGILLAPVACGVLLAKPLSVTLLRWLSYKRMLIINTLFMGLSLWTFMLITAHISVYVLAGLNFIFGFLTALQYTGINSLAYAEVLPEETAAVTSIMSTVQQLAQSLGVAMSALCLRSFSLLLTGSSILTPAVFHLTFLLMGLITLLSTLIFLGLTTEDGKQMLVKANDNDKLKETLHTAPGASNRVISSA